MQHGGGAVATAAATDVAWAIATHSGGDDKSGGGRVVVKAMVAAEGGISKRRAVGICSGCGGLAARLARAGGLDTPD